MEIGGLRNKSKFNHMIHTGLKDKTNIIHTEEGTANMRQTCGKRFEGVCKNESNFEIFVNIHLCILRNFLGRV